MLGSGTGKGVSRRKFLRDGSLLLGGLTAGPSLLGLSGCQCNATEEAAPDAAGQGSGIPESWRDYDVRLQLRDALHLADIDHHGVFVDFGTAARYKYTLGNWRTGWGDDVEEQGVSFTWTVGPPARGFFHLEEAAPIRMIFRLRKNDNGNISIYVNDQSVTRLSLPEEGWSEQIIDVPADKTDPGENTFKLVYSREGDNQRAFAVDYLRIIPGSDEPVTGADFLAPTAASISRTVSVGDQERPALTLRAPTRLSYYLEFPQNPHLGLGVALIEGNDATARVHVTDAETGRGERVHRAELTRGADAAGWQDAVVDLGAYSGKVVRLDFEVESQSEGVEVAFSNPALLTQRARVEAGEAPQARNVVVLLIDTLRADALTAYSETRIRSPQMDRFAREGVLFEKCQAPANWTKPSCASVLTGLHPPTHRALAEGSAMASSVRMVSEMFQEAGFQTAALIANGYMAAEFGFNQGWNLYRNYIRERQPTEAENVFNEALAWMESNREQRTFTYIQTIDPHVPYDPPEEDLRLYDARDYDGPVRPRATGNLLEDFKAERVHLGGRDRARLRALYDGEVTYHDRHFGRFLDRLQELNLLDDTLIVVCSDHGEEFFEHDSVGHGHSLYQELLHVPLILRMPGLVPAGERSGDVCGLVDIVPTILEASGVDVPQVIEGRSLVPGLRGRPTPVVRGAFSSQWDTGNARETSWTARVGDWKLRMHGPASSILYNLRTDPGEEHDADEDNPLALRATRVALGQFLGAPDKGRWTSPEVVAAASGPDHDVEEAQMTPELCEQLRGLGYVVDACD